MTSQSIRPFKATAVYRLHLGRRAQWADIGEWRLADSFGDPAREAKGAREGVGLEDASPIGKIDVKGTGIDGALTEASTRPDVLGVLRIKPGHALILTAPNTESVVQEAVLATAKGLPGCAHATDITSARASYFLVGPRATDVLNRLTSLDVRPDRFGPKAFGMCDLAHVHATVYRDDWGSLPAYLVVAGRDVGEYLWTVIETAGAKLGLTPFGLAAERLLRQA